MTLTRARTIQYMGILLSLGLIAVGYWYWSARAGVKSNTAASQPQGKNDITAGLALYWPLDNGSGTTATDLSTNGNNGTLNNFPTWTTGQISGGVDFNGTDNTISVADPASDVLDFNLSGLSPGTGDVLTLSAWFNRDTSTTDDTIIAKKNDQAVASYGYIVWIDDADDKIHAEVYGTGGGGAHSESATSTTYSVTGRWHHVVVSMDEYLGPGDYRLCPVIYVDGVNVTDPSSCGSYLHYVLDASNSYAFTVGAESDGGNPFDGKLDEIRVYNRPVTVDEINQLYALTSPTSGIDTSLKGYWSFSGSDTTQSGTYDRSGAGNNGTLTNGPTITMGKVGQALTFDGTDDYVTIPDSPALSPTAALTVSFWAKITGNIAASAKPLVYKTASGARSWFLRSMTDGGIQFAVASSTGDTGSNYGLSNGGAFVQNEWAYVTAVFDGSQADNATRAKIYVNGVQQAMTYTGTISATLTDTAAALKFGDALPEGGSSLPGLLDEVRIYNRALSVTEIKSLYDVSAPDKGNSGSSQAQGTGRLDSGLVSYWKLDENTGTSTSDASTNSGTGTLTNGPTWVSGQIGSGVDFDGTNDYIIAGANNPALIALRKTSVAFWIYPRSAGNQGSIFASIASDGGGNGPFTNGFEVSGDSWAGTQTIRFAADGSTGDMMARSTTTLTLNTWTHVVVVWDGTLTAANVKFYLNGVLSATTGQSNGSGSYGASDGSVMMGTTAGSAARLDGKLDEVRVYDRILSSDEVGQLYRLTTPTSVDTSLKGYWSFNGQDMSGTTAYDRSGAGNDGTLTNGPAKALGKLGQGVSFDGTDDYIALGNHTTEQTVYSIMFWFYQTGLDTGPILHRGDSDGCFYNPRIDITPTSLSVAESGCSSSGNIGSVTTSVGWHHVGFTRNGSSAKLYLDGELIPTTGAPDYFLGAGGDDKFLIGAQCASGTAYAGSYTNTKFDELRVYNRVLSANEIRSQYDVVAPDKSNSSVSQTQGTGRLDSGLAGYWKMDENTGTTVGDSSTNANTGSRTCDGGLCTNPAWTTGQIGSGLDFNGTNNYVNIPDAASLRPENQSYTVAAWAKPDNINQIGPVVTKRQNGGSSEQFYMTICSGSTCGSSGKKLYFSMIESGGGNYRLVVSANDVADGNWHHLVAVANQRADTVDVYVDGVLASGTKTSNGSWPTVNNTDPLRIGSDNGSLYYNGAVDEVRTYSRALSEEEIVQLYRLGTPTGTDTSLKGYWSFNGQDMSGTTAYDRSGAGNTGTLTGGPTKTIGKVGQALAFDGTDDYVTMGDIASMEGGTQLTVSVWMKQNGATNERHIIDKSGCNGTSGSWEMLVISGVPAFGTVYSSGNYDFPTGTGYNVSDNQWHHLVGTYDGATISLYVDGTLADTAKDTRALMSDSSSVEIGGNCNGAGSCSGSCSWNGQVDEARVYNRAFSADEVKILYNQSK